MSEESKRLRGSAAKQLRKSRQTKDPAQKAIHLDRAASIKEMAHNEEWLSGSLLRSKAKVRLTRVDCIEQSLRCRVLAKHVMTQAPHVMLNHIADTWERIAADVETADLKRSGK